jgi:hypothetical protein
MAVRLSRSPARLLETSILQNRTASVERSGIARPLIDSLAEEIRHVPGIEKQQHLARN